MSLFYYLKYFGSFNIVDYASISTSIATTAIKNPNIVAKIAIVLDALTDVIYGANKIHNTKPKVYIS